MTIDQLKQYKIWITQTWLTQAADAPTSRPVLSELSGKLGWFCEAASADFVA